MKSHLFPYIREACDFVCPFEKECYGHKFLNYIEFLWRATAWAVEEKEVYYRYFHFTDFKIEDDKVRGWHATPVEPKDLSSLTYSRRMAYLNI